MKKVLLLFVIALCTVVASAQNAPAQKPDPAAISVIRKAPVTGRETGQPEVMTSPVVRATPANFVGHTNYDLQTNSSLANRIVAHEDGTVSFVWTASTSTASTRGTGYNYFDGTSLVNPSTPITRIENTRAGWGTIGSLGSGSNTGEIVVSHNGTTGLIVSTRETKGTGAWNAEILTGPSISPSTGSGAASTCLLWPAIATVEDTIHLVACTESDTGYRYNGIQTCLLYYRGVYNRTTHKVVWESPRIVGDMTSDKQNQFSGDSYSISANGNRVAVLFGDVYSDLFYWISNDGGTNWTKEIIFDTPLPDAFNAATDLALDTPFVPDGSNNILIDDNGTVHVAFSITRILNEELGTTSYSWYPSYDALVYWNSTMPALTDETDPKNSLRPSRLDEIGIKMFSMLNVSGNDGVYTLTSLDNHVTSFGVTLTSMPQMSWDNGTLILTYCSEIEYPFIQWDMSLMYRGVFLTKSDDNGASWDGDKISWLSYGQPFMYVDWAVFDTANEENTAPYAILNYSEDIFPAISKVVDGKVNLLWQSGLIPGSYIRENENAATSPYLCDMNWLQLSVDSIGIFNNWKEVSTGVWNVVAGIESVNTIRDMKIYPNPATEKVNVAVETTEAGSAALTVTNLLGQIVHTETVNVYSGMNLWSLNVSGYPSGFYTVTIKSETGSTTKKLIIQ